MLNYRHYLHNDGIRLISIVSKNDFFPTGFEHPFAYEFLMLHWQSRLDCDSPEANYSIGVPFEGRKHRLSEDADYDQSALFFVGNNVI